MFPNNICGFLVACCWRCQEFTLSGRVLAQKSESLSGLAFEVSKKKEKNMKQYGVSIISCHGIYVVSSLTEKPSWQPSPATQPMSLSIVWCCYLSRVINSSVMSSKAASTIVGGAYLCWDCCPMTNKAFLLTRLW